MIELADVVEADRIQFGSGCGLAYYSSTNKVKLAVVRMEPTFVIVIVTVMTGWGMIPVRVSIEVLVAVAVEVVVEGWIFVSFL